MEKKKMRQWSAPLLALALTAALTPAALAAQVSGRIEVDGSAADWDQAGIEAVILPTSTNDVTSWRAARGADGTVYLCFQGEGFTNATMQGMAITPMTYWISVGDMKNIPGAAEYTKHESNGWGNGPFTQEFSIPASYFTDPNFTLTFGGTSIQADALPTLDDVPPVPSEPPVYDGITIDGDYGDWAAVQRHEIKDPGGRTNEMALVFDDDLYIYIYEIDGSAATSGTNSDGVFCVTSDLGYQMKFKLESDGTVSGVAGAESRHVGRQWELRIPKDQLPAYKKSVSIGFDRADPQITDVPDLSGSSGTAGEFSGIVIDGQYGDWLPFPHTAVGYGGEDGSSYLALYLDDTTLYGHVSTTVSRHLAQKGKVMLEGTVLTLEGGGQTHSLRLGQMATGLSAPMEDGTRLLELYWPQDGNTVCGSVAFTINGVRDEMEFNLDLVKVAEKLGVEPNEFKAITIRVDGMGSQEVSFGGASSGPWLLLALLAPAAILAGGRYYYKRREDGQ